MLHLFHFGIPPCCNFSMLHFFHVILFPCYIFSVCTLPYVPFSCFMLALILCVTHSRLHSFRLHFFHVGLFQIILYHVHTHFILLSFMLQFFHVALFSRCILSYCISFISHISISTFFMLALISFCTPLNYSFYVITHLMLHSLYATLFHAFSFFRLYSLMLPFFHYSLLAISLLAM